MSGYAEGENSNY